MIRLSIRSNWFQTLHFNSNDSVGSMSNPILVIRPMPSDQSNRIPLFVHQINPSNWPIRMIYPSLDISFGQHSIIVSLVWLSLVDRPWVRVNVRFPSSSEDAIINLIRSVAITPSIRMLIHPIDPIQSMSHHIWCWFVRLVPIGHPYIELIQWIRLSISSGSSNWICTPSWTPFVQAMLPTDQLHPIYDSMQSMAHPIIALV
jgi:hypothetical protein